MGTHHCLFPAKRLAERYLLTGRKDAKRAVELAWAQTSDPQAPPPVVPYARNAVCGAAASLASIKDIGPGRPIDNSNTTCSVAIVRLENGDMIDRCSDVQEITRAVHIYARALDQFRFDDAVSVYTEDAYWDATAMGLKRCEGRDEMRALFESYFDVIIEGFHIVTNHLIDFDGPDTAHGTNYLLSEGTTKSGAAVRGNALNEDAYRRTADGWQICGRRISPLRNQGCFAISWGVSTTLPGGKPL